jgi:hypothetical protein
MNTNAAIITIAKCIARDAVEDQIRAQGYKLRDYAPRDITKLAQAYLAEHPELLEQAEQVVMTAPALRRMCKLPPP